MGNENIFREKSLKRLSSPEELHEYIHVVTPGVWVTLICVLVFLAGVILWSCFGYVDSDVRTVCVVKNKEAIIYVRSNDDDLFREGMPVKIDGGVYSLSLARMGDPTSENPGAYALEVGGFYPGEYITPIHMTIEKADGIYKTEITVESIHPITFLWR